MKNAGTLPDSRLPTNELLTILSYSLFITPFPVLNQRPLLDPTLWKDATLKIAKSCNKMLQTNEPTAQLPSAFAAALAELKADNEAREARAVNRRNEAATQMVTMKRELTSLSRIGEGRAHITQGPSRIDEEQAG
ncbi:hypothetical protein PGT21_034628 [Puccinia graminis f. sp. tritici]|uniref:Uncharacterized protein n=1 Tax=Puccinia graminis f. sp. tritici TaxID=56615 RepID=A0A5B0P2C9_PUCGR|nr:hypothetical protein PGTUg99_022875 [Puccinia graminis f. sp. tritici]KAA1095022.1 hypothetical protein PGT21_034628 [Puccinia graminis f. sp. tritici]